MRNIKRGKLFKLILISAVVVLSASSFVFADTYDDPSNFERVEPSEDYKNVLDEIDQDIVIEENEVPLGPLDPDLMEPAVVPSEAIKPPRRFGHPLGGTDPNVVGEEIAVDEIVIDEDAVPLGQPETKQAIEVDELVVVEAEVPLGNTVLEAATITTAAAIATLPQTGQSTSVIFYLLGAIIAMLGVLVGKKKIAKQ